MEEPNVLVLDGSHDGVFSVSLQVESCFQEPDHHPAEPGQEPSQPQPQRGPGQPVAVSGGRQWLLHPGEIQLVLWEKRHVVYIGPVLVLDLVLFESWL